MSVRPDIETFQTEFELWQMLRLYETLSPDRVLEVGCYHGGTLWYWLESCTRVVAVDDEMRNAEEMCGWADRFDCELNLVQGRSQDADVVKRVRDLGPYGFVFIDADHTYDAVKSDWDNYRPLVQPGGVMAFHDIRPRPDYGVSQLWAEIKTEPGAQTVEIMETPADGRPGEGIGMVWL